MNNGRWVIVTIFAVACAATAFAWWFRGQQGDQALQFWGSQNAYAIRFAPEVTAWRLQPDSAEDWSMFPIDGQEWYGQEVRISQAKGLRHARQALIEDASFRWEATPSEGGGWNYALRFDHDTNPSRSDPSIVGGPPQREPPPQVTLLMNTDQQVIRRLDGGPAVRMTIGHGMETFLSEQFAEAEKPDQ